MAARSKRGEVWQVDLGFAAKVRPGLVLSIPADDTHDRVLVTVVTHTTSARGTRFEVSVRTSFLKEGVFDAQSSVSIPAVKLVRRLGILHPDQLADVERAVLCWLGIRETRLPA